MGREEDKRSPFQRKWGSQLENLAIVILAFYPLRHIGWGLDLQDTGYSYANFQYMGTEHMDPMWLFSTYLANVVGNLLTKLPNADTLRSMNLYTGLFASVLALTGYFFCTRKLKIQKPIVFLGEMVALSLCWCPTAVLYNYLTYVLFLFSSIFLYLGLINEKKGYLICAGVLLGSNVLVRFSNLPEAAMIVAVWAYDIILWLEGRKRSTGVEGAPAAKKAVAEKRMPAAEKAVDVKRTSAAGKAAAAKRESAGEGFWRRIARHTGWCLLGYAAALCVLLGYIHVRYGIQEYIAGIQRLFGMTENAADYKPTAMIAGILNRYAKGMYWVVRLGIIVAGGLVMFAAATWVEEWIIRRFGSREGIAKEPLLAKIIHVGVRLGWAAVCVIMIGWLYLREFGSLLFYAYDSIYNLSPVFLMLIMFIAVIRIFHRGSPKEEKLISGMLLLIILLTSIGSNNDIFPSLNNLFLAAPYMLWECWRFLHLGDKRGKKGLVLASFPVKGVLVALLAVFLFQLGGFGVKFAFAEGGGIQEPTTLVENNAILKNIKMSPQRAEWMTELSAYVEEEGLQGKEVILYGSIPALSYYLQMPSAFNPWSDLRSYGLSAMQKDMDELEARIGENGAEKPVVILENLYALYVEAAGESTSGLSEEDRQRLDSESKWRLLLEYMEAFGYEQTFRNEKFAVYR